MQLSTVVYFSPAMFIAKFIKELGEKRKKKRKTFFFNSHPKGKKNSLKDNYYVWIFHWGTIIRYNALKFFILFTGSFILGFIQLFLQNYLNLFISCNVLLNHFIVKKKKLGGHIFHMSILPQNLFLKFLWEISLVNLLYIYIKKNHLSHTNYHLHFITERPSYMIKTYCKNSLRKQPRTLSWTYQDTNGIHNSSVVDIGK